MIEQADRLYTAKQVRRLDKCAIEGHGIPGIDLMERAGRCVFDAAQQAYPDAGKLLVLCGGGNNGGDGYIVARLAIEAGIDVDLCALKEPSGLKGDAALAAMRWKEAGGVLVPWPVPEPGRYDVIFDALLGTGLDREPAGVYAEAIESVNQSESFVVAIDIPSGLNADTGVVLGSAVVADLTVTFIGSKRGLFTADGPDYTGDIVFDDLGTPSSVRDSEYNSGILIQEEIILDCLPPRLLNSHKGNYGWMLAVGSEAGMSGAVRLCGEAALRSGAGKVTIGTRSEHASLVNVACPELMVKAVTGKTDLDPLLENVDVVVTGTGLGRTAWSEEVLRACLHAACPTVLDADGLNILAEIHSTMEQDDLPTGHWILTPHPAEAGRLLGCFAKDIQQDRVGSALKLADKYSATIVLKGCGTVIADEHGRYAICPLGNPGMATAGSGDVLAGVIGAMLAQGLDTWEAALAGVVAHASAGDLAAEQSGQRGMLASDITAYLPAVLNPV
jgi:NAD(P)H-hydrate epimerase